MKKNVVLIVILILAIASPGLLLSQTNKEDEKFEKLLEEYFDSLWKFYPTQATLASYHTYDGNLEDIGSNDLTKRHEELDEFNQKFITEIDRTKLSPDLQIDHEMIIDGLDYQLLMHENILPWEYNPLFYNQILNSCIRALTTKEFAPIEERAANAISRLKAIPGFIKQAKNNLKTPPQLFTELTLMQFPSILSFYKVDLPLWIEQVPSSAKNKLQQNLDKAITELESYQGYLENELLPQSTGTFRLSTAHTRLVRDTFQNILSLQELIARAQADYKNIRREMFLCCMALYKIMEPKINIENPPPTISEEQLKNEVISHVLSHISSEHASKDEFLDVLIKVSDEVKNFLSLKDMITIPEADLKIKAMSSDTQGLKWYAFNPPGIYETEKTYLWEISPFPEDIEEETIMSFLQEYNNFFIYFWATRNIFPGSFVPVALTQDNPSIVRKHYANLPLMKGWSLFLEEKLVTNGFKNYDIRMRLNQLKCQLRAVQDFILEFNIHESGWTQEQAVAYMVRGGFQTQAEAERKWNQIALNPGYSAYGYVGFQELLDLEKEYKAQKGDAYSLKEFMDDILQYGLIPIRILKTKLFQ